MDDFQDPTPFLLSVGDLMAALLLLFVLALSATLLRVQTDHDRNVAMAATAARQAEEHRQTPEEYREVEAYQKLVEAHNRL